MANAIRTARRINNAMPTLFVRPPAPGE